MEIDSSQSYKVLNLWTDSETQCLLEKYASYLLNVGPMKEFKTKRQMWEKIAESLENRTGKQCEERYKTVKRRTAFSGDRRNASKKLQRVDFPRTKIVTILPDTSTKRQRVDFPRAKIVAVHSDTEEENSVESETSYEPVRKFYKPIQFESQKMKTMQETLIEIVEKKEEAKEKRHRERMEHGRRMEKLLEKLIRSKR